MSTSGDVNDQIQAACPGGPPGRPRPAGRPGRAPGRDGLNPGRVSPGRRGQKAAASRMSRRPVFGSVAWPVRMPPKSCPATQMNGARTTARIKAGRAGRRARRRLRPRRALEFCCGPPQDLAGRTSVSSRRSRPALPAARLSGRRRPARPRRHPGDGDQCHRGREPDGRQRPADDRKPHGRHRCGAGPGHRRVDAIKVHFLNLNHTAGDRAKAARQPPPGPRPIHRRQLPAAEDQ